MDKRKTSLPFAFFLLFPQFLFFGNMLAHTVAVVAVNVIRMQEGTFRYSFHFYSLLLFGIVFMVTSGLGIRSAKKRIEGDRAQGKTILWLNGMTVLFFLPVIPLNPIGALPVLASLLSSITLGIGRPFRAETAYKNEGVERPVPQAAEAGV